jgi:hypothetical protein
MLRSRLAARSVRWRFPLGLHHEGRSDEVTTTRAPQAAHPLFQELGVFVLAVIVGSLCGLATNQVLGHRVTAAVAGNAALAVATTCTGAAHAHFVHKQPWLHLLPKVGLGAPLAYGVMRVVHAVLGS